MPTYRGPVISVEEMNEALPMEVERVLRASYGMGGDEIFGVLLNLLTLERVHVVRAPFVLWALDRYGEGADLADMLHLISARGSSSFATFDRELARYAGTGAPVPVGLLQ
jgi:predicted nucleic-acid-binding protein